MNMTLRENRRHGLIAPAMLAIAAMLPLATGCQDDGPAPDRDTTLVTITDSTGAEQLAEVNLEQQTRPYLDFVEGGAPEVPQTLFTQASSFVLNNGSTVSFTPGSDGTKVEVDGERLPMTLSWNQGDRAMRVTADNGSWIQTQLHIVDEADAAYYGGVFALSTVIGTAAEIQVDSDLAVPILGLVIVGAVAYAACVTLGCYFMCNSNCGGDGTVDKCGCGIKVWRETELGYWCNCKSES